MQTALGLAGFFVEARVLQCDRDVGAKGGEHALVLGSEGVGIGALQIKDPDEAILQEQRYHQFGAHDHAGLALDVARIVERVGNADGASLARGNSGDALMKRQSEPRWDGIAIAHPENAFEELGVFIPQHHAEDMVVDQLLDPMRHAPQQLLAIENRSNFAADLVEQAEARAGLLRIGDEQTCRDGVGIADQWKWSELGLVVHIRSIRLVPRININWM